LLVNRDRVRRIVGDEDLQGLLRRARHFAAERGCAEDNARYDDCDWQKPTHISPPA
jgi:hypothetical protein